LLNTSLISSGSVKFTLGVGPNQIKEFFPACRRYEKCILTSGIDENKQLIIVY